MGAVGHALAVFVAFVVGILLIMEGLEALTPLSGTAVSFISPPVSAVAVVAGDYLYQRRYVESSTRFSDVVPFTRPSVRAVVVAVLGAVGLYVALNLVSFALVSMGAQVSSSQTSIRAMTSTGPTFATTLVTLALLAPICEELLFRGAMLSALAPLWRSARRAPRILSILLVAVLFATLHFQSTGTVMDVLVLATTFTLGACCAVLRIRTGSIIPAIIFHATYNCLGLAIALLALL